MANWNLYNASGATFVINNGNIGTNTGSDGYIEWDPNGNNEYIVYQHSWNWPLIDETEYQLEFWYDVGSGNDVDLTITIYGPWDGILSVASGIEFNTTLSSTMVAEKYSSIEVSSDKFGYPIGTTDPTLANRMIIKYNGTPTAASIAFDNFSFKRVLGYQVAVAETLPNWSFFNPIDLPGFIPGQGALDFTTYPDEIYFPSGLEVVFDMSAILYQTGATLLPGHNYVVTMDINNDVDNTNWSGPPVLPSYNDKLFVNTVANFQGNQVTRVPITEDNGIGTAEWSQQGNAPTHFILLMEPGGVARIDNIVLNEVYQSGGTVTNWNLLDLGNALELYWSPVGGNPTIQQGSVVFDTANPHVELNQVVDGSVISGGDQFRITFNVSDYSAGEITSYLYNDEGKGFVFGPIDSNGLHTFNGIISQAILNTSNINNVSKFGIVSGSSGFKGTIDNITLEIIGGGKTLSFGEDVKGWSSFKSFTPDFALSVVGQYYTTRLGKLYKHHQEFEADGITPVNRNNFYGDDFESSITPIFNMQPEVVKNFNTLNYEGSQSKVDIRHDDNNYYNLTSKKGWYVGSIHTDMQEGSLNEFIEKEGKWFNYIKGLSYQVDTAAFNFQGIGIVNTIVSGAVLGCMDPLAINFDPLATFDDGSCVLPAPVFGCMNPLALNFDPLATIDDGTCTYAKLYLLAAIDTDADLIPDSHWFKRPPANIGDIPIPGSWNGGPASITMYPSSIPTVSTLFGAVFIPSGSYTGMQKISILGVDMDIQGNDISSIELWSIAGATLNAQSNQWEGGNLPQGVGVEFTTNDVPGLIVAEVYFNNYIMNEAETILNIDLKYDYIIKNKIKN